MKSIAHGITRVIIAKASGQSSKGAFLSGFIGSSFASTSKNFFIGTIHTALLGGTASKLSGGKFANGAESAAFVHMFNALNRGIQKAFDNNVYPKGKKYGDGYKEVIKGTINGAISTKNVAGVLRGGAESAITNIDTVSLDIKTTIEIPIYMTEQFVEDTADTMIDYNKSIKDDTFNWDEFW